MKRLIVAILLFLAPLPAGAASILVQEGQVNIEHTVETTSQTKMTFTNNGREVAHYRLTTGEWQRLVDFDPAEFELGAGQTQSVTVRAHDLPPGNYATSINVYGRDIREGAEEISLATIPLNVTSVLAEPLPRNWGPVVLGAFLAVMAVLMLFLPRLRVPQLRLPQVQLPRLPKITLPSISLPAINMPTMPTLSLTSIPMPKKQTLAIAGSIAGLALIAVAVVLASPVQEEQPVHAEQDVLAAPQATMVKIQIAAPTGTYEVEVETTEGMTAFDALRQATEAEHLSLSYDPPAQYGVFIKEIAGVPNGRDNKYWVYEVNGEPVPEAADKHRLQAGDIIVWKFIEPQF